MIDLAQIRSTDTVLDIGAGTGALTLPLAEKAGHVLAIETDPAFVDKLLGKMKDSSNIRVKQSDFLEIPLPRNPFAVVANIPYSITTPIMGKLLECPGLPLQRAALLVEMGHPNVLRPFPFKIREFSAGGCNTTFGSCGPFRPIILRRLPKWIQPF